MGEDIPHLKLTGIAGFCKGSEFLIEQGGEATIGRSRNATFRIREGEAEPQPPEKPFKGTGGLEKHLLTVSGIHARVSFRDGKVLLEDLSRHGCFIDGKRIQGRDQIIGLGKSPVELRLGTNETFRLELIRLSAKTPPRITVKRPGA
jgi:pSer/pThr/pTyr-binding forkhead associated (FHA) protein